MSLSSRIRSWLVFDEKLGLRAIKSWTANVGSAFLTSTLTGFKALSFSLKKVSLGMFEITPFSEFYAVSVFNVKYSVLKYFAVVKQNVASL